MGILDRFSRPREEIKKRGDNPSAGASAEAVGKTQEAIAQILNSTVGLVPEGVNIKLQPWESPANIRAVALEVKQQSEGNVNKPHTEYEVAVMPPEYDKAWVNNPEYAGDQDSIWTGDGFISKRTEEIVSAQIKCEDYAIGSSLDHPMHDYYKRQRYFVTVNDGRKVLPRASVYHFANGQVQTLICQYNKEARPQHYEEAIDGKIVNTVNNTFDADGNIRTTTTSSFDSSGKLTSNYEAKVTYTPGENEPWRMVAEWFEIDGVSGTKVPKGNRQVTAKTHKGLHVSADLRVRNFAMPDPVNQTTQVSRPGYPI